ncbi:MAG: IS110 family transposase, partial [Candidatus Promineifilaceae bacterium]|nr:IS110 family transposase [Candidatus Promineifilaceae bacterium]
MNLRIIGIDLAVSAKHKAMILDPASNEFIGGQLTFRARPADLAQLLEHARQEAPADVPVIAILEATGMAWYPVAVYLERQGVEVFRVNGQKTKDFRRALWKHTGSDQIDSRVLARLYQIAPDRLSRCPLPNGDLLALQRACRAYARWREADTAMQNRMQAIDCWAWDGLHKLIPAAAQSWMRQHWYNPWRVQEAGAAALTDAWLATPTTRDKEVVWIDRWVERARQMTALYGSEAQVGYDDLQATMCHLLELRQQVAQEQSRLTTEKMLPLYHHLFPDCPLTTVQGVGLQSAAIYRAFIQDIDRFPTVEMFGLWCGMVPRSKQSGDREAKGLSLTKAGPNLVKATLYLNAEVARQWDGQMAAIYHRQMVDYGKHHLQAVCACASHLANRIFALLRHQRPYQLRDTHNRPITKQQSRELCQQLRV